MDGKDRFSCAAGPAMKIYLPLGALALLASILVIINGLLPQIQMALLNGRVPFLSVYLKFMIFALGISAIASRKFVIEKNITLWWIIFVFDLVAEILLTTEAYGINVVDIIFGFNAMYFWILVLPFAAALRTRIKATALESALLLTAAPIMVIGYLQLLTNNPILPTVSADDRFQVLVYIYYGFVRPFSIFSAPAYYATFVAFVGFLVFWKLVTAQKFLSRIGWLVYFVFSAVAEYTSYGRAEILAFTLGLVFLIWWRFAGFRLSKLATAAWLSAAFSGLIVVLGVGGSFVSDGSLFKNTSLLERVHHWNYWATELLREPLGLLFGIGVFQNGQIEKFSHVIIDNMAIAVAVQIGIVGLLIAVVYMYYVWRHVAIQCSRSQSGINMAQLAFLSLWPVFAMFGTGLNIFPIYAFVAVLTSQTARAPGLTISPVPSASQNVGLRQ